MSEDLATRIARLEDRAAIEELVAQYAIHAAAAECEAMAALFTEDGVFDGNSGRVQGRENLVKHWTSEMAPGRTIPITGQIHISVDGNEADLQVLMATTFFDGKPGGFCGIYNDRLRKVEGAWKFACRHYRFYHKNF